jgi:hypothetical protein
LKAINQLEREYRAIQIADSAIAAQGTSDSIKKAQKQLGS